MTIKGKVVKILDEYSVVVDVGSVNGVEEDMEFVIYEEGEPIEDPDTGEEIGNIEFPKARVKPYHIMENMTVMESSETEIETYDVGPSVNIPNFSDLTGKKKVRVKKELPLDEVPESSEKDTEIQLGDLAREYLPETNLYSG